ncbi:MAG: hypothetical protein QOD00_1160 [Blastocatellia bacterium]|jgi:hypothetical protein|nr:hypothetical protein [Blastocatellia bacterium]
MSDAKLEEVLEEVKALSPEERERVRDVLKTLGEPLAVSATSIVIKKAIDLLPDERRRLVDALNRHLPDSAGPETKAELVESIIGKYAHLIMMSSDDFAALKAEEIALEDRRRGS